MSRTRRKKPHWVKKSEQLDKFYESLGKPLPKGWDEGDSTNLTLRQKVETGNFDMSDPEGSEDIEYRRARKRRQEEKESRQELEEWEEWRK